MRPNILLAVFICILLLAQADGKDKRKKHKKPNRKDVYLLLETVISPLNKNCSDPDLIPTDQEVKDIMAKLCSGDQAIGIFPKGRPCSFFVKENMDEAVRTSNHLMDIEDYDEFMKTSIVLRKIVNEEIYVYAFTTAVSSRDDTKDIQMPSLEEVLPYLFFSQNDINAARNKVKQPYQSRFVDKAKTQPPIPASKLSISVIPSEGCLDYLREDISMNSHHWNWHRLYPTAWTPRNNTMRDRKGELFFYLHEQILARYDAERFSCGLPRVIPYNLQGRISERYYSTVLADLASNFYPGRDANLTAQNVPSMGVYLSDIQLRIGRLQNSTSTGLFTRSNGTVERFTDPDGINNLGALVEASSDTINRPYYGNVHNNMHVIIARITNPNDPEGNFGVMGFTSTAMRDPIFYRVHKFTDDFFNRYKMTLPVYTNQDLAFNSLTIDSISMIANNSTTANRVGTYWQERMVDISRGVDFASSDPILITIRHLQHDQFNHNIDVDNKLATPITVTVRIFIAPKYDDKFNLLSFESQRRLFIELDKYTTLVNPGKQRLIRRSVESSVTIPTPKGFSQLADAPDTVNSTQQAFCGCGWPDHLLLPRGLPQGMAFTYFVMLTNGSDYKEPNMTANGCSTAPSYCGIINEKYPDTKTMGYPFDRRANNSILTSLDFAARVIKKPGSCPLTATGFLIPNKLRVHLSSELSLEWTWTGHDRHALGFYEPLIDSEQNFDLLNAYENATHTVLRFSRKLNTCDKENDNVITDDTIRLIYSWHPADPVNNTGLPYHGKDNRGSRTVFLLSPQPPRAAVTDGIVEWEIHMPNVTIPPQITTYWCIFAQAPEFEEEHQYIGYDIKIAPGNENIVHHFVLFECLGDPARLDEFIAIKGGYECVKEGTLAPPTVCQPPLIVWLAGSEGQRLPDDVGIPLGRKFGGTSHFELQIHYNNIEKTPGLVDSSSLILYLTKKKRPIRAAILQGYANIDYTFILPPNQRAFRVSAFAPPECTQSLPEDGITIFATGLHGHLAARKFAIRHFRNNTELKPITVDNQYSFYYQAIRQLKDYVKVYPGDTLMVECEYSTEKSNATVAGGYGTESEMCTFFISYYPKTKLSLCIGGPHNQDIYDYFGVEKLAEDQVHIESPASLQNHSMFDHVKGFDWSKKDNAAINRMAQMQYYDVKKIYCLHNPEDSALDKFVEFAYPTKSIMYPPEPDQCAVKAPVIETYETEESEYESKEATKKSYY